MNKNYTVANEVEELATKEKLLQEEFSDAKIKYLFNMRPTWDKMGQCSLAGGKWKYLTGYNYVIEINCTIWNRLNEDQKKALTEHELKHICYVVSKRTEEKKWRIRKHDFEEFTSIIQKYGAWNDSLKELKEVL